MSDPAPALRRFVEDALARAGLPGLAVAVTSRDGLLASTCFGLADVARGEPVAPATRFEIGSIGKSFTAVAVLQLREEGRLELDAPVESYLPWFEPGPGRPVTVHHLLTHTSGLVSGPDVSSDSRFDVWALRHQPRAEPGRHYHYSNIGYRTLGYVLEELEGAPYEDVIRERILEPLGMRDTDAAITYETRRDLAVGYERLCRDRPLVPAPWVETGTGDGSIVTSAEELTTFVRALLHRGQPLLSRESFELLVARAVETGPDEWYGYGLGTRIVDGRERIGHSGSMPGFAAMLVADLAAGLGAVALLNGPDEGDLTKLVAGYALALWRGDTRDPPAYEPPEAPPLPEDEAAPYTGRYCAYNPWLPAFRVVARGESLSLAYPSGREQGLVPLADAVFRVGEEWSPERLSFDAIVDGEALRANLSGCDYYRV